MDVEFTNIIFFVLAFIWHLALLVPGLREKILTQKIHFSFLAIAIRLNYYLQMFLPTHKFPFGPGVVRAISPFCFTSILLIVGGSGNLLFTLLGSIIFELVYFYFNKNFKVHLDVQEIPKVTPIVENVPE